MQTADPGGDAVHWFAGIAQRAFRQHLGRLRRLAAQQVSPTFRLFSSWRLFSKVRRLHGQLWAHSIPARAPALSNYALHSVYVSFCTCVLCLVTEQTRWLGFFPSEAFDLCAMT